MNENQKDLLQDFLVALRLYIKDLESAVFIPNHSGQLLETLNKLEESLR